MTAPDVPEEMLEYARRLRRRYDQMIEMAWHDAVGELEMRFSLGEEEAEEVMLNADRPARRP